MHRYRSGRMELGSGSTADEMPYRIHYFGKFREAGSESWRGTFWAAKEFAMEVVESGAAERIEIRHEDGKLAYQYPKITATPDPE